MAKSLSVGFTYEFTHNGLAIFVVAVVGQVAYGGGEACANGCATWCGGVK